jgi:hypothetical protein
MLSNKVFFWVSLQKKRLVLVKALFFYRKIIVGLRNLADIDRPDFILAIYIFFFPES